MWTMVGSVAGVIALGGLLVAWIGFRRQFPKRELLYRIQSTPLIHRGVARSRNRIQVMIDDSEVADPWVVSATVWSRSRADISSAAFDSSKAIEFRADTPMIVTTSNNRTENGIDLATDPQDADGSVDGFFVPAQLIRKSGSGSLVAISEGEPTFTITNTLIDIEMKNGAVDYFRRLVFRSMWRNLRWAFLGIGGLAVSLMILAVLALINGW